jgi:long-chain acyl-CoA synthetase
MTEARPDTLCGVFQWTARICPDAVALRTVGGTETLTWRDYARQVRDVAAGAPRWVSGAVARCR